MTKRLLRAVTPPLIIALLHLVLLAVLAKMDTVRQLLGSANPSIGLALVLFGFYVLRLVAIFLVPGWLIARVAGARMGVRRQRLTP